MYIYIYTYIYIYIFIHQYFQTQPYYLEAERWAQEKLRVNEAGVFFSGGFSIVTGGSPGDPPMEMDALFHGKSENG